MKQSQSVNERTMAVIWTPLICISALTVKLPILKILTSVCLGIRPSLHIQPLHKGPSISPSLFCTNLQCIVKLSASLDHFRFWEKDLCFPKHSGFIQVLLCPRAGFSKHNLQGKFQPKPTFVNKVLLEHSHAYSCVYGLWLILHYKGKLNAATEIWWCKLKIFTYITNTY